MRFNSILGAFLFILLASFIALMTFVHTSSFGRVLTKVITDISERKAQTKVSIKSVGLSVFPPGIELHRVQIKKVFGPEESLNAEVGRLGFYLSLIEVEEKKLAFGEIRIQDSVVNYQHPQKDEPELKELDPKIIDMIFGLPDRSPIRIDVLLVENLKLRINHDLLEAKRFKLFKRDDRFMTRFHLANIKPLAEKDFFIDEAWGEAMIGRKDINLQRLRVHHDVHTLLVKGKIKDYPLLKNAQVEVLGEASFHLKNLKDELPVPEMLDFKSGAVRLSYSLSWLKQKLSGQADIQATDLHSNLVNADVLNTKIIFIENSLRLDFLEMHYKEQQLKLLNPAVVVHLNPLKILPEPLNAHVENFSLSNALRFLGPSFKVLKGDMTGKVSVTHVDNDFFIHPANDFVISNLGLVVGTKQKPFTIVMVKKAQLRDTEISILGTEFHLSSNIQLAHSQLEVDGYVGKKKGVHFSVIDATIDLEDFGNISNLDIKGKGKLSIDVSGPLDDTVLNFKGKTKGFEVLGYKLGETEKDLSIALGDSSVIIHRLESKFGSTNISGNGVINYNNLDIALGINSPNATFQDLMTILDPIFSKLTFLPSDLDLSARIDAHIYGKTRLNELKIKSDVNFTDLFAFGESINSGSFTVAMMNEVLSIQNFDGDKGKGSINGDFSFSLPHKKMKLDFKWENLLLSSFTAVKKLGLNIDGKISGSIKGEGPVDNYNLAVKSKIFDTNSQGNNFEDSNLDIKIMPNHIAGTANLLGKMVRTEFDHSLNHHSDSKIKLQIDVPDIKPFSVAIFGQHLDSEEFKGDFKFNLDSRYTAGFKDFDLKGTLGSLNLQHNDFNVAYQATTPQFVIEHGHIKAWDLNIQVPDLYLVTNGKGSFGHDVNLVHDLRFNSKIFELLLAPVLSSEGYIKNVIKIAGQGDKYDFTASSSTDRLSLSLDSVPFPITDLSYNLDYYKNRLYITQLTTTLDSGHVSVKGDVFFNDATPDVNLKFVLDRAEIPILGKSVINISGEGTLLGNDLPYNLSGDLILNKALIVNELDEFTSKSSAVSNVRFLPKSQEPALGRLFYLNVNVKAENNIRITNSLMDVGLRGELRILGNPSRPRGEGRLYSPPNTSRVFFKNSEWFITNADLNFTPKKELANADFDVQAMTLIATYKVYAKAYGDLERFNFDLTSDPPLARNSILSLIAFGYTDEVRNSLTQGDQASLSQASVGSFVFDRFKISDILKKQFGLQINLGTVVEQSQYDSLLSGRSQEGQGGTLGRTRSATKIELKKRLDEAVTLSVSSTMGGSIGQRQNMTLSYGISKEVQLDGVYEVRSNADGETDIIDKSAGGDIKFRRTFK